MTRQDSLDPSGDWGPFGRPLFDDPSTRALSRVGVVDVGSNSVRMVVFDGAARSPAYFFNEKVMCELGSGLSETGYLNPEGRERALAALQRFNAVARAMGLPGLTVVATAAVRDARDGPAFRAEVQRETGLKIWVIKGKEEARLSAQGVLLGWPGSFGLVCDIGGSSMELAEIRDGRVGRRVTSGLGPLKLREIDSRRKRHDHIKEIIKELASHMGPQPDRLFLVGGSWRAIARIDMERRGYPLHVLHEYRMTKDQVIDTLNYIEASDADALRQEAGVSGTRMALVPYAAQVLARLVKTFKPKDIAISSYGIREGLLYEQMPQKLRDRDPLIEACRFAEAKDARRPGFGRVLYDFVRPLFEGVDHASLRLIKAACLLHDVSWRAHPDYRAEACFDYVTRANLGGLKHGERVFLGLALMYRYRSSASDDRFAPLIALLDDQDDRDAMLLGRAMRLGAMLWVPDGQDMPRFDYDPKEGRLVFHLTKTVEDLFSEVPAARLKSLAQALGAKLDIRLTG
ncbi:MAG: Ppx/GppA family phosphatase [Rhodobacteraceae bacterium]|nr:Ppx/GppA family phosphatase [Paracoccaceae bacterium]